MPVHLKTANQGSLPVGVPDYQALMQPVLTALADGQPKATGEIREAVARTVGLSQEDRETLVPSGQKLLYNDRVAWAISYLKQAGVLERPERGVYRISERGQTLLSRYPDRVDNAVLGQFEEFRAFLDRSRSSKEEPSTQATEPDESRTPEESLQSAFQRVRAAIEAELLEQVRTASPPFFERLVVELLVAMGYGGSLKDAGQAIGRSGDEGIDGIIKEDRLGLDRILIQAKRWTANSVGRPAVQSFAGSLEGARGRKGIFITTSTFTPDARAYVERIEKRIVLIDGEELVGLMYDHGVGVTTAASYHVKRVDSDYCTEE
jgi:restriction system protein